MAKITWTFKNEEGTNLNRYIATNVSTGEKITFDLLRGGNISVVGTPLNAENLNALITSINACYDLISSSEKDTTYTLSKNGNAIRLTSSSGAINDVTLGKSDVGLGNVDNTSDMDKPISNATQKALNDRVPITRKINGYSLNADITLNKSDVGLTNVDNTSDLDKPISNDTKKALAGKADLVNGKLPVSQLPDSGITVDVAKKVIYKEEAKDIEEIFDEELNEDLILDIECDHEYEITGQSGHEYSLAIPDESSVKLKKIQGQTARYSLNEYNGTNIEVSSTDNVTGFVNKKINIKCSSNTKYTLSCNYSQSNSRGFIAIELNTGNLDALLLESSGSYTKTFTTTNETSFDISFYSCTQPQINSIIFSNIMFNEGEPLPYQPYDNTLVNSKCDFVSTNKNWFDYANSNYTDSVDIDSDFASNPNKSATKNYTLVLPNTNYVLQLFNATAQSYQIYTYDKDKNLISKLIDVGSSAINFTTPSNCYYIRLSQYNGAGNSIKPSSVMLNYGTEAQPYQPHKEDVLPFSIEMGKFDSWENGVFTKGQSEIITLNGSENWQEEVVSIGKRYYINKELVNAIIDTPLINNANLQNKDTGANLYTIGYAENIKFLYITTNGTDDVAQFKSWLSQNPITFAYKLATPTTQELPFTNIMKVWNSGLQQQKIEGKYLPYILTKEYAISLKAQVDNNTTENYLQDARIKENKAEIENLKTASVDYTRVYIPSKGIYLNEKIRDVDDEIDTLKTQHITDTRVFITEERIYLTEKLKNIDEKISFIANNTTAKATKSAGAMSGTIQGIDGTYPTTITANILKYLTITPTATKGANVSEVTQVQYDSQTGVCTINVEATNSSRLTGVTIEYTYSMEILWQNRDNLSVLAEEE